MEVNEYKKCNTEARATWSEGAGHGEEFLMVGGSQSKRKARKHGSKERLS